MRPSQVSTPAEQTEMARTSSSPSCTADTADRHVSTKTSRCQMQSIEQLAAPENKFTVPCIETYIPISQMPSVQSRGPLHADSLIGFQKRV
jgi:hypothetical protein